MTPVETPGESPDTPATTIATSPTEPPTPIDAPAPTASPIPEPLNAEGPWLAFADRDDETGEYFIWAANEDGSGLQIAAGPFADINFGLWQGAAPSGGRLAFVEFPIRSFGDGDQLVGTTLKLISFPDLNVDSITTLLGDSANTAIQAELAEHEQGNHDHYNGWLLSAILAGGEFAWSPDGRLLAFSGAMDGPSSDLYLYDTETGTITRKTEGEAHVERIVWSRDGSLIAHQGISSPYSSDDGVWVSPLNGSGNFRLAPSNATQILGWLSSGQVLTYRLTDIYTSPRSGGHGPRCLYDPRTLRIVNSDSSSPTLLRDEIFVRAVFDPVSGMVLVSVRPSEEDCEEFPTPGVFLLNSQTGTSRQVGEWANDIHIFWSPELSLFIVSAPNQNYAVTTSGTIQPMPNTNVEKIIDVSPNGEYLLATIDDPRSPVPCTHIYDMAGNQIPDTEYCGNWLWSTGGRLAFLEEGTISIASSPDFIPLVVMEGSFDPRGGYVAWINP